MSHEILKPSIPFQRQRLRPAEAICSCLPKDSRGIREEGPAWYPAVAIDGNDELTPTMDNACVSPPSD
jgi:hypothetical protein